jgi:hypothetical protein
LSLGDDAARLLDRINVRQRGALARPRSSRARLRLRPRKIKCSLHNAIINAGRHWGGGSARETLEEVDLCLQPMRPRPSNFSGPLVQALSHSCRSACALRESARRRRRPLNLNSSPPCCRISHVDAAGSPKAVGAA